LLLSGVARGGGAAESPYGTIWSHSLLQWTSNAVAAFVDALNGREDASDTCETRDDDANRDAGLLRDKLPARTHTHTHTHLILFHALGSSSASAPSHSPVQQLGTVYLTLYEALNPLTLSKDYLNPFYFQSYTLAFHFQLQHVN